MNKTTISWAAVAVMALWVGAVRVNADEALASSAATADAKKNESANLNSRRIVKTINADWKFSYFPDTKALPARAAPQFDDAAWRAVAVPHTWSTYETTGDVHPFIRNASPRDNPHWWNGWGWYRKRLVIGKEYADRKVFVEFDGVSKYSRVYLNGQLAGEHKGGYTSFSMDVSPFVKFGEENVLAVEACNRQDDPFGIPPMTAGNWDVYAGIYREVRLVLTDKLHVPYQGSADHEGGTFVTTPTLSATAGVVRVRTYVRNDRGVAAACTLRTEIVDPDGARVARFEAQAEIAPGAIHEFDQMSPEIKQPRLWSPETPVCYTVLTQVMDGGKVVDHFRSPLGFRWFRWEYASNKGMQFGMYFNGRAKMPIVGMNRHEEYPWLGSAVPGWIHEKELREIRYDLACNFMRTCHYPQGPGIYDLCDRIGIMICEEVPNIKRCNFNKDVQKRNVTEMIRRDRNHPSILMWSMGNETDHMADPAWAVAEDTTRIVHTRKATAAGVARGPHTEAQLEMEQLLQCTVRGWPDREVFAVAGRNVGDPGGWKSGQITGTEEFQHLAVRDHGATRGAIGSRHIVVWLYADHGLDREYMNAPLKHVNPKGWVDVYRVPKYVYYLWQAHYLNTPVIHIHPYPWRREKLGQKVDIRVDSNCPEVELFAGDKSVGKRAVASSRKEAYTVRFEAVPVENCALRAVGTRKGKAVEHMVKMAGLSAKLVLRSSHEAITADRAGIAIVTVDIVDAVGVPVPGATNTINWSCEGPGSLVGPAQYISDRDRNLAINGVWYITTPVAIPVRSGSRAGTITVKASSPGLAAGVVTIRAVAPEIAAIPGIVEPPVADTAGGGRVTGEAPAVTPSSTGRLAIIYADLQLRPGKPAALRALIDALTRKANPSFDFKARAKGYEALLDQLAAAVAASGLLLADDYNFAVERFNDTH